MDDLRAVARMLRYGAESFIVNLRALPEERLDWRPSSEVHTPLQIVREVVGGFLAWMPVFAGGDWDREAASDLRITSLEAAEAHLRETTDAYAAALEAAGSELERPFELLGETFWARRGVLFPVLDLYHHHGQICLLQMLLGDAEPHWPSMEARAG